MNVFEYDQYKPCVNDWVRGQPKNGYGVYRKMAEHLGTNSVIMSQVFRGARDLNLEQAAKLCELMSLNSVETDYFLLLVQNARAGTQELRKVISRQLDEVRSRAQAVKNRIQHQELTDEDKTIFYSSWYYIATWLALTVPQFASLASLASHFQVPEQTLAEISRFLLDKGLLIKKDGQFDFGRNVIHVPHDSPFVVKHHMNWRMKALQSMDQKRENDLHYTAPMAMSAELRTKIREELVQFIQRQTRRVAESPSETLVCFNIDYFNY